MVSNCPPQHRILRFESIENRAQGRRTFNFKLYLALHSRERAQVIWKHHSYHDKVCTSTDRTAGRSRTIGFHVSPLSADT